MGLENPEHLLDTIDPPDTYRTWRDISTGLYDPDILNDYLEEAKRVPLITSKSIEYTLIRDVQAGYQVRGGGGGGGGEGQPVMIDDQNHPAREHDDPALQETLHQAEQSLVHLQMANCRLIYSIVKKYHGIPFPDRYQEGAAGLTLSIYRFNFEKDVRLSTWATYYIRRFVSRAVQENRRTIRVPHQTSRYLRRFFNAKQLLTQEYGHTPTDEEICERFPQFSKEKLREYASARYKIRILSTPIRNTNDITLEDTIADDVDTESEIRISMLRSLIEDAQTYLSERELRAITLHYVEGLTFEEMTHDPAFTKQDGTPCHRSQADQVTKRAVQKLKIALKGRGITEETLLDYIE